MKIEKKTYFCALIYSSFLFVSGWRFHPCIMVKLWYLDEKRKKQRQKSSTKRKVLTKKKQVGQVYDCTKKKKNTKE